MLSALLEWPTCCKLASCALTRSCVCSTLPGHGGRGALRAAIERVLNLGDRIMDHVYKTIEITGTSHNSAEEAIRTAVAKAAETIKHMRWFKVAEVRGNLRDGKIDYWQVTVDIGFTLE